MAMHLLFLSVVLVTLCNSLIILKRNFRNHRCLTRVYFADSEKLVELNDEPTKVTFDSKIFVLDCILFYEIMSSINYFHIPSIYVAVWSLSLGSEV